MPDRPLTRLPSLRKSSARQPTSPRKRSQAGRGGASGPRGDYTTSPPGRAADGVKDLERGDVLGDVMDAEDRGAGGGGREAGRDGADKAGFMAARKKGTEKGLARDADEERQPVVRKLAEPGHGREVL